MVIFLAACLYQGNNETTKRNIILGCIRLLRELTYDLFENTAYKVSSKIKHQKEISSKIKSTNKEIFEIKSVTATLA